MTSMLICVPKRVPPADWGPILGDSAARTEHTSGKAVKAIHPSRGTLGGGRGRVLLPGGRNPWGGKGRQKSGHGPEQVGARDLLPTSTQTSWEKKP